MKIATVLSVALFLAGCQSLQASYPANVKQPGQVQIGAAKDQVRQLLGQPNGVSFYKRLNEEVWTYEAPTKSGGTWLISFKGGDKVTAVNKVPFVTNFSFID